MTITAPVAINPALLPLPDPADRTTFSARKLEQLRWANNEYSTGSMALATASYNNALDAQGSATECAASAAAANASAAAAALASGVTKWVSGTTYGDGVNVWSPTNFLTYRRKVAGAGTTDPISDPANWQIMLPDLVPVIVSATTHTATAGTRCILTNVAATGVTLPPGNESDIVAIVPANALEINTATPNAADYIMTGTLGQSITLDAAYTPVTFQFLSGKWRIIR